MPGASHCLARSLVSHAACHNVPLPLSASGNVRQPVRRRETRVSGRMRPLGIKKSLISLMIPVQPLDQAKLKLSSFLESFFRNACPHFSQANAIGQRCMKIFRALFVILFVILKNALVFASMCFLTANIN